jgi:HAD superfamily hydrolase (TIGR01548 family)
MNAPAPVICDETLIGLDRPDALLLDVDGVLVDVRESYRQAIVQTVQHFGGSCTAETIVRIKEAGDANNDWKVTQRILAAQNLPIALDDVTAVFESIYQGTEEAPGVWQRETLTLSSDHVRWMCRPWPCALVTGRPKRDVERFIAQFRFHDLFTAVVCMQDAKLKPAPDPALLAMERIRERLAEVQKAWFLGDTPDDMRCACAAGQIGIGILAPGEHAPRSVETLRRAGASRVFASLASFAQALSLYWENQP